MRARLTASGPRPRFRVLCDSAMAGHIDRIARWAGGRARVVERSAAGVVLEIEKI